VLGGIFIAGSLAWGAVADGYRPDRFDSQTSMTTGMIMGRRR
jgi:drug/metabolite transporter superfamily protein YnfA